MAARLFFLLSVFGLAAALSAASVIPLRQPGDPKPAPDTPPERVEDGHIRDISEPTLTLFPVPGTAAAPRPAVLVIPGGGYSVLSYEKEGTEIAAWLNGLGLHAAVVKYRVPGDREAALQDVRRAVALLRGGRLSGTDPARIGLIGFSAGAHLAARVLAAEGHGVAFAMLIYPAYLSADGLALLPESVPSAPTVPTFVMQCCDDRLYRNSSLAYAGRLMRAGRPVSFRLYGGGHGFGLRVRADTEAARWPGDAEAWLRAGGLIR